MPKKQANEPTPGVEIPPAGAVFDVDANEMLCVVNGNKVLFMGKGAVRVTVDLRGD